MQLVFARRDVAAGAGQVGLLDLADAGAGLLADGEGVGVPADLEDETSSERIAQAAVTMVHAVLPRMLEQEGGSIVNVASMAGVTGLYDGHAYTAAKGASVDLTKSRAITYDLVGTELPGLGTVALGDQVAEGAMVVKPPQEITI